ncbi:MAG: DUF5107 domain-containing protein [Ignavibacteriaceae bacterium]
MKKFLFFFLFTIPSMLMAQVVLRDTTIVWHTFKYELNDDNTIKWNTNTEFDTVSKIFAGIILENEYLKVTVIPEFGARIVSMIYKPTGKEELYLNPCGAPYGVGEDWFYYKWLMVYGGIFPTLPEPEHGKAWLLPWVYSIVKETPDTVCLQMSWKDTVQLQDINLGKWQYGETYIKCNYTLTLVKGVSSLEANIDLYNDSDENLNYEYWTCLTLAPGSEPGNPMCSEGTELIIPASEVKIPSWYPDIAAQEKRISGQSGIYTFTKLRLWKNWTNDGIAYAWDDANKNYWGVINHTNEEGFFRIADNNITPGIKIWAWGYQQSRDIDPFKDPNETHRPYVELWAGNSNEFFVPAQFAMNSEKHWKEIYLPTVGLSNVTNANDEIISDFKRINDTANLAFVASHPQNYLSVKLEITGHNKTTLAAQTILPDPVNGNKLAANLPENQSWSFNDSLKFTIKDSVTGYFLSGTIPLDTIATDISEQRAVSVKDFRLYQNYPNPFNPVTVIKYQIPQSGLVTLKVYDILGKEVESLVNKIMNAGHYDIKFNGSNLPSGIYFYQLKINNYTATKKLILLK